jgi:hypothetical protein
MPIIVSPVGPLEIALPAASIPGFLVAKARLKGMYKIWHRKFREEKPHILQK